jgi:hypothetical protein
MLCSFANMDKGNLDALQSLEGKLDKTLIAVSWKDLPIAELNETDLQQIKGFETEHGVFLVAVQ